jgi:raffinose/stachyose/melibiose transport system substrate-binding protein
MKEENANRAQSMRRCSSAMALTLAGSLLMATGACSSNDNTDGGSPASVTITVSMQNADVESSDPTTWSLVEAFRNKYPEINVELTGQAVADHDQMISVAAQSGTLPTVFWVNNASVGAELSAAGALLDLTDIVADLGLDKKIPATALAILSSEGVQFGLPYQELVTGFYYNRQMLSDNSLELPTTFDEFVALATALKAKGIVTVANGSKQGTYSVWSFLTMLARFGYDERIEAILDGSESFNNPDFLKFYEAVERLYAAGAFATDVAAKDYAQAQSDFTSGKAAMWDSGVWAAGDLQSSAIAQEIGFWPGPEFANGVGDQSLVMNVAGAPLSVSAKVEKGSPEYDAVSKFFDFYYSDEGQQIFIDNGQPPVTNFLGEVSEDSSVLKAVLDAVHGKPSPLTQPDVYLTAAAQQALYESIYGVIGGEFTAQEAIEYAAAAIDGSGG